MQLVAFFFKVLKVIKYTGMTKGLNLPSSCVALPFDAVWSVFMKINSVSNTVLYTLVLKDDKLR